MDFEFDPQKSQSNKLKHGIDFEEAKALWSDPNAIEIELHYLDEKRRARIGRHFEGGNELWTAIFTLRGEKVRLISVRRARMKEKQQYG